MLVTRAAGTVYRNFCNSEDGSFNINNLSLNNCFSYRQVFQNGIKVLSKRVLKIMFLFSCLFVCLLLFLCVFLFLFLFLFLGFFFFFGQKAQNFVKFRPHDFCLNFASMRYEEFLRNVWRDFIGFQCQC